MFEVGMPHLICGTYSMTKRNRNNKNKTPRSAITASSDYNWMITWAVASIYGRCSLSKSQKCFTKRATVIDSRCVIIRCKIENCWCRVGMWACVSTEEVDGKTNNNETEIKWIVFGASCACVVPMPMRRCQRTSHFFNFHSQPISICFAWIARISECVICVRLLTMCA